MSSFPMFPMPVPSSDGSMPGLWNPAHMPLPMMQSVSMPAVPSLPMMPSMSTMPAMTMPALPSFPTVPTDPAQANVFMNSYLPLLQTYQALFSQQYAAFLAMMQQQAQQQGGDPAMVAGQLPFMFPMPPFMMPSAAPTPVPAKPHRSGPLKRKRQGGKWSKEESQRFAAALDIYGYGRWEDMAEYIGSRNARQCEAHYTIHYGEVDSADEGGEQEEGQVQAAAQHQHQLKDKHKHHKLDDLQNAPRRSLRLVINDLDEDSEEDAKAKRRRRRAEELEQQKRDEERREREEHDHGHSPPALVRPKGTHGGRRIRRKLGHWTDAEHKLFMEGLERYGEDGAWDEIAAHVGSRDTMQVYKHYHIVKGTPGYGKRLHPASEQDQSRAVKAESDGEPVKPQRCNSGWWTEEEHQLYLEGLETYGDDSCWAEISKLVGTRTIRQVQAHHQIVQTTDNYGAKLSAAGNRTKRPAPQPKQRNEGEEEDESDGSEQKKNFGVWHDSEHRRFVEGLRRYGEGHWDEIAEHIGTRDGRQVKAHFAKQEEEKSTPPRRRSSADMQMGHRSKRSGKGRWSEVEQDRYLQAVKRFGVKDFDRIAAFVGTRDAAQVFTHFRTTRKYEGFDNRTNGGGSRGGGRRSSSNRMDEESDEDQNQGQMNNGRWYRSEHRKYLEGYRRFGDDWDKVAEHVGTRTALQIQSHHHNVSISKSFGSKLIEDEEEGEGDGGQGGQGADSETQDEEGDEEDQGGGRVGAWTQEEQDAMQDAMDKYGLDWKQLAISVATRTPRQVKNRYFYVQALSRQQQHHRPAATNSGGWSADEHQRYLNAVRRHGIRGNNWAQLARYVGTRDSQQLREHHFAVRGDWSPEEHKRYLNAIKRHGVRGNNWAQLARHVGTRDSQQVREHHLACRSSKMGYNDGGQPARKQEKSRSSRYAVDSGGDEDENGAKKMKRGVWKEDEHFRFLEALEKYGRDAWEDISKHIGSRSARQSMLHYEEVCNTDNFDKYLKDDEGSDNSSPNQNDKGLNVGRWSEEEHARFTEAVRSFGYDWKAIAESVGTRDVKQCINHHKGCRSHQLSSSSKNPSGGGSNRVTVAELTAKFQEFQTLLCTLLEAKKLKTMTELTDFIEWYIVEFQLKDPQTKQLWQCTTKWLRQLSKTYDLHQLRE